MTKSTQDAFVGHRPKGKSVRDRPNGTIGGGSLRQQAHVYKFISRQKYYSERSYQRISALKSTSFGGVKKAKNRHGKGGAVMRLPWLGYKATLIPHGKWQQHSNVSADDTTDESHMSTSTTLDDMEIKTSSKAAKVPIPSTVKTIEVEYHPKLSVAYRSQASGAGLVDIYGQQLSTQHQQGDLYMSKQQQASGRSAFSSGPFNGSSSLSDQVKAESDRCITEQFEREETNQTFRRGLTKQGVIVEHTQEQITTTKMVVTRDVFKYMMYQIGKAKGRTDIAVVAPETLSPRAQEIISGSKDAPWKIPKQVRKDRLPPIFDSTIEPSAVPTKPSITGSEQSGPSELSLREPSAMEPSQSVPGREPSAREPSETGPGPAGPSELSMREQSAMGPSPSAPGREPSAREPSETGKGSILPDDTYPHGSDTEVSMPKVDKQEPSKCEILPVNQEEGVAPRTVSAEPAKSSTIMPTQSSMTRQVSMPLPQRASTVTIKSIALPTKVVKVEASGRKPLIGSEATVMDPAKKSIIAPIKDDNEPERLLTTNRPQQSEDTQVDDKNRVKDRDMLTGMRSENPNLPSPPGTFKKSKKEDSDRPSQSEREPTLKMGLDPSVGREPNQGATKGEMDRTGVPPGREATPGFDGNDGGGREPSAIAQAFPVPSREPSTREPSIAAPGQESPAQGAPSELSMREPSAVAPAPSVPGREPSTREPSIAAPGQESPAQGAPSELSMREPSAMGATPSVPGREPSTREPSSAAPGQESPAQGAPSELSMREPSIEAQNQERPSELSLREPSSMAPIPFIPVSDQSSSREPPSIPVGETEPSMREPTLHRPLPILTGTEPIMSTKPVTTIPAVPTVAAMPSIPTTPSMADTSTNTATEPRTIIFRPTIVIVQNVFVLPASFLAQLQASNQSLVNVANQEVFIFPNSIDVSHLGAHYGVNAPSTNPQDANTSAALSAFLRIQTVPASSAPSEASQSASSDKALPPQ